MATHSSILAGEFHGQRSLVGHSPWGRKELDMQQLVRAGARAWLRPRGCRVRPMRDCSRVIVGESGLKTH